MTHKRLVLEFVFEETPDEFDEGYTSLELRSIARTYSDLDEGELNSLGEDVAQSDTWQVDRWIDIQHALTEDDGVVTID